jgi:MFS family permease
VYSLIAPSAGKWFDKPQYRFLNLVAIGMAVLLFILYAFALQFSPVLYTLIFFSLWGVANAYLIPENFRLVMVSTPKDLSGAGAGVFNVMNNLSAVIGVCIYQAIFSFMTHAHRLTKVSEISSGWSMPMLLSTFKVIFLFGAFLYLLTLFFSALAEKASRSIGY